MRRLDVLAGCAKPGHTMSDFVRKFKQTWFGTSVGWRIALVVGWAGLLITLLLPPITSPSMLLAALRTIFLAITIPAVIANKLAADDFYRRVYSEASVFCVSVLAIILFASNQFEFSIGNPLTVVAVSWLVGFAISFYRLRGK